MNELSIEPKMTVKEVANILGVTDEAIKKHVREIFPEIIKNGKTTYLTEPQVTIIKTRMMPTTQVVGNKTDLEKELIIRQAMIFQEEKISKLEKIISVMSPKADFYDQVIDSTDAIDVGEVAKVLNMGIGRNKLFDFLRRAKILMPNNQPYQAFIDRGYFRTIETSYTKPTGETCINIKTVVYQSGVDYIRKLVERSIIKNGNTKIH